MPTPSRRRVQCPNCNTIKQTRGNHYFVCDECRMTFDIEPNRFQQNDSKKREDSGNSNQQNRSKSDMGETGNPQTDNNKDGERESDSGVEGEPRGETLEFG